MNNSNLQICSWTNSLWDLKYVFDDYLDALSWRNYTEKNGEQKNMNNYLRKGVVSVKYEWLIVGRRMLCSLGMSPVLSNTLSSILVISAVLWQSLSYSPYLHFSLCTLEVGRMMVVRIERYNTMKEIRLPIIFLNFQYNIKRHLQISFSNVSITDGKKI